MKSRVNAGAVALFVSVAAAAFAVASQAAAPVAGPNVNMVSGTKWPEGDPFLTKQNEPTLAISSRNSRHLLAAANDYRLVPVAIADKLDDPEAWIQIFKSVDGGATWRSTPLGGCPINIPECNDSTSGLTAALKQKAPNFGADPTVRAGPYGTFFVSHIAGTRDSSANGVVGVQRFVDKDNDIQRVTDVRACPAGSIDCTPVYVSDSCTTSGCPTKASDKKVKPTQDPILPDVYNIIDAGTPGQFKDKPWVVADVPGRKWNSKKSCTLLGWTKGRSDVADASETVPAFNVYVSYANFTGQGPTQHPEVYVATSIDCGQTFTKGVKIGNSTKADQGTNLAVDPLTGYVYVAYRNFDGAGAIMVSRSTDGGVTWSSPVRVQSFGTGAFPYDQGATGVSFRTLGFPTIAVSVKNGVSRVHIAWSQRKATPAATAPYACTSQTASDCDAHIVMKTSTDGVTWSPAQAQAIDGNFAADPNWPTFNPANPNGRGHQVQPALAFAAGKLLATWLDQRLDHTEGVLKCPTSSDNTCAISARSEFRRAATNSNLDPNCKFPAGVSAPLVPNASCYRVDTNRTVDAHPVWSTYITDGTPYLVRRHTLDTYAAMADPDTLTWGGASRVSQYTFGNTVQGQFQPPDQNGQIKIKPSPDYYEVVQKEINPPNLPMFSNGQSAFIGDYIDVAGQLIVASGDPAQPYKFNVGAGTSSTFAMGGFAPAFQVAFTDNRDVIPPSSGHWETPACLTTDFTYADPPANTIVTGVNTSKGAACQSGYSGNRNQNVYTATLAESAHAYAEANSKLLNPSTARGFVVSVRNVGKDPRTFTLTLRPADQGPGVKAAFDRSLVANPPNPNTLDVFVQPRSTSARTVWATSSNSSSAKVVVQVTAPASPNSPAYSSQVVLNADPNAPLATNGDGASTPDTTVDSVNSVVLSNAVLTNNALSNNALTNNVLSNNALTNAVLSNVVLSNAALSNLDPVTAALSNNVLSNAVLSNVVLSNAVLSNAALSNNVLSNAVLSNVVLSNNAQNAALTNLDPTNAALSNAVLSNNVLSNVVLSNAVLSNNALSNAVLSNAVLSNAVLSNAVLSNAALTNNAQNAALSNDPLRTVALSNAPLGDASQGGDPDALRSIETGTSDIVFNNFAPTDIANSQFDSQGHLKDFNFKETTFTLRNRGNTDTIVGIKLLLRDAVCSGPPNFTCTPPTDASGKPLYKLQLVLRKVALVPVAVPGTTNANIAPGTGISPRSIRIGLAQVNTEVSNVTDVPLVDPSDSNFGKFQNKSDAAILSLGAGEWVYATVRAIGVNAPDPADLLQWGLKTIAADASNPNGPLVIRTQSFPSSPAFVALTPVATPFETFGGNGAVNGSAVCSDQFGNAVLNGANDPTSSDGAPGNFFINTVTQTLFGPKNPPDNSHPSVWWPPTGTSLIVNGPSGPQASVPCPPAAISFSPNPFTREASPQQQYSDSNVTFTPKYWGDFYLRANVSDASSPAQTDQQVIKVHVNPRPPVLTYTGFPSTLTYNTGINLRPLVSSDSKNGAGVVQPIVFNASGSCHMATDGDNLVIDRATVPITGPADCIVAVHQDGNEIFAPKDDTKAIFIDRASQAIVIDSIPASGGLTYNNNGLPAATLVAHATSTTAPNSGLAVTFTSQTPSVCTVTSGGVLTIMGAGTCTITADQGGSPDYKPAPTAAPPGFVINLASQALAFGAAPTPTYNQSFVVSVTSSSPTAPPSGIPSTFTSLTPGFCAVASVNVVSPAVTSATISTLAAGTCTIAANELGNSNYNPAPQVTQNIVIAKADQAITFGTAPAGVTFGDAPVSVSATSASPTAPPSGIAIVFTSQTLPICTISGTTVTIVGAGTCTIAADQGGDGNYNAAPQATQSFGIAKAPTVFTVAPQTFVSFPSTPSISGTLNRPLNPTLFPANGVTATLKKNGVIVVSTNNPYTPPSADPNGAFTVSDAGILPENYTVTFDYAGNANFLAATSLTTALRVEGFSNTGNMSSGRAGHSSTLLNDGNVLVVGGDDGSGTPTGTADVYCTAVAGPTCTSAGDVGTFKAVGALTVARFGHTATLLADGTVLVAGGIVDSVFTPTANAEVYCTAVAGPLCTAPADVGKFKTVATTMQTAHAGHTATLLGDNTVLLVGGVVDNVNPPTNATEVYCTAVTGPVCTLPADVGKFKSAASMTTPRDSHTATLLADGTVLVTGGEIDVAGNPTNTAEIYCTAVTGPVCTLSADVGNFKPAASTMSSARSIHTATLLADGRVLVAGGDDTSLKSTASADVYCPLVVPNCLAADVGKFKAVGNLVTARAFHAAALLTDGFAVVAGGVDATSATLKSSEVFDPGANNFIGSGPMSVARSLPAATRLPDGRVLVTGGRTTGGTVVNSAELYNGPF